MQYIKVFTPDNFPFGGAPANFVRNFSLSLSKNDQNDVEVIMPRGNFFNQRTGMPALKKGYFEGIKYRHLGFVFHPEKFTGKIIDNIISCFLGFMYLIKMSLMGKVDNVIVYNTSVTWSLQFLLVKLLTRKKLVYILPEYYQKPVRKGILAKIKWYNFYLGLKLLAPNADKLIVLTHYMKELFSKKNFKNENIFVLPNITDTSLFKHHLKSDFIPNKKTIGYCGTPTEKDGIMDLLKSFGELLKVRNDVHLLVIGDKTSGVSVLPELKKFVRKIGIESCVTFTGLVSSDEVIKYLNQCRILTLTRPEGIFASAGFPTKLGEYFACGIPVLATRVGDMPKYFTHKEHLFLVNPGDIKEISAGFNEMLNEVSLCEKMVENASEWVYKQLDFRQLSKPLNEFIEK